MACFSWKYLIFKELCSFGVNGGAKRNVYVEGLLRLVLLADLFLLAYVRFTWG